MAIYSKRAKQSRGLATQGPKGYIWPLTKRLVQTDSFTIPWLSGAGHLTSTARGYRKGIECVLPDKRIAIGCPGLEREARARGGQLCTYPQAPAITQVACCLAKRLCTGSSLCPKCPSCTLHPCGSSKQPTRFLRLFPGFHCQAPHLSAIASHSYPACSISHSQKCAYMCVCGDTINEAIIHTYTNSTQYERSGSCPAM